MSLKAASTLSRAVGASLRPVLALRSVGAEFAAASVLWPPPHAPKPPQAPSLLRHTSSVAGAAAAEPGAAAAEPGAAAAEPREASEEFRSTKWWGKFPQKKREKLLVALAELEQAEGEVPLELALSALKKLEAPPEVNVVQALVSSGFVAQVQRGLQQEKEAMKKQTQLLAAVMSSTIESSLKVATREKFLKAARVSLRNPFSKAWAEDLPTYLAKAKAKLLDIETKLAKMEAQEAIKSEVLTCKKSAGDELWEILKRCGVVRVSMKMMQGTTKAEDRVKVLKSVCSHSVDSLAKCDIDKYCDKELPEHVSASMVADFKAALRLALHTAWFNSQARALGVVNLAVPLRALLLLKKRGEDAAKKQLEDAGVVDKQFIQRLLKTDEATLDVLVDNFGWMLEAGDAFRRKKATVWDVFKALMTGLAEEKCLPNAEEGEKGIEWTTGCSPIFMDGILEAVVLRLPIWNGQPFLFGHDKTGLTEVPFGDLSLQGLRPTTYGIRPESPSTMLRKDLSVTTYVLTRGRVKLFEKATKTCFGTQLGVMTTASHGTGKSASMRALALMLGLGAGGDVMYLPKSEVLVPGTETFKKRARSLMEGGLALSCAKSLKKPELCQDMASIGIYGADAHEALERTMVRGGSVFHHNGKQEGDFPTPSLLIIDEANSVQGELLRREALSGSEGQPAEEDSLHAQWWYQLKELFKWTEGSSKVFAFSPDFHASLFEKKIYEPVEELFEIKTSNDMYHPFFEMERMRPELAFRLMLGPKDGKGSLGLSKKVGRVADMPAGHDSSLQLPPRAMEALRTKSNLKMLKDFIESVDGVARPLSHAAEFAKSSTVVGPTFFSTAVWRAWIEVRGDMERRCLKKLQSLTSENLVDSKPGVAMFLDHSMAASSILTRVNPDILELHGNVDFASHIARHAFIRALLRRHREIAGSNADQATKDAWDRLLNGVAHLGDGTHFEHTVATLLEMGMFGSDYTPLSKSADREPVEMLRSYFYTKGTNAFSKAQTKETAEGAGLSAADVYAVQTLKPKSVHVVRTPHSFPAVDFVVFRRPPSPTPGAEHNRAKLQVAFIETTVSSLETHGQSRKLKNLAVSSNGSLTTGEVVLPQSLRDIANLACNVKYFTEVEGSQMKFRKSNLMGRKKTTMANAILWTFGVPVDLNCTVQCYSKKEFDRLIMEPQVLSGTSRSNALANAAQLLRAHKDGDERDDDIGTLEVATSESLEGEDADERAVAVEVSESGAGAAEAKEELENLPLAAAIQESSDVEFFFIYCTPQPIDEGSHSTDDARIPGFYGVFELGFLPPEMKSLEVPVPAQEKK